MSTSLLPAGARDLLPTDLIEQEKIRHILLAIFKSWGYQPVLPPTLESLEALDKGRPQFLKECFKVIDGDGQLLALRPDLTLPIARLAATRLSSVERPLRLCYTAKVFRQSLHLADERREIYQAGIELIGCGSTETQYSLEQTNKANLECLSILLELLNKTNIQDYKIVLSHTDLWRYAGEILHKVEEYLEIDLSSDFDALLQKGDFVEYQKAITRAEERCQKSFKSNKVPSELKAYFESNSQESPLNYLRKACYELTGVPSKILEYLDSDSDLHKELSAIIALEKIFGPDKFIIDFTLRPDSHYYTGLYFEVVVPSLGKPIGKGGRYNNLISCFGSSETAIGFSLQVDSLLKHAKDQTKDSDLIDRKALVVPLQGKSVDDLVQAIKQSIGLRAKNPVVTLG
jgi:ATP phosphoribosyltransferase regulatory subunit